MEKGKMRSGGTAPPGPKCAEKPRFFPRNARPYGLKRNAFQTEKALGDAGALRASTAERGGSHPPSRQRIVLTGPDKKNASASERKRRRSDTPVSKGRMNTREASEKPHCGKAGLIMLRQPRPRLTGKVTPASTCRRSRTRRYWARRLSRSFCNSQPSRGRVSEGVLAL